MYGRARQALLMKDSRCRPRRNFVFFTEPFRSHLRGRLVDSVLSRLRADKILIFLDFRANSVGSRIQFLGDWQAAGGWGRLVVLIHTRIIPQ